MSSIGKANINFYDIIDIIIVYTTNDNITSKASTQSITSHSVTQCV